MNAYEQSKKDIDLISDQENEEKIDEDKLNELDMEVSNYINYEGNDNEDGCTENNQMKLYAHSRIRPQTVEMQCNEPELNFKLIDENENQKKIIAEYQIFCKDLEKRITQSQEKITELEEQNKVYKDENEKYKDENESLQFQLKLASEKEKIHEENFTQFKELQNEYENYSTTLNSDFKVKEDGFKKKYKKLEDTLLNQIKSQENEYEEKNAKLTGQIKEYRRCLEGYEKDIDNYKQKIVESEKSFTMKEKEFEEAIHNRDKKLKELEQCIKSISDDANIQINKLSENVEEFSEKINLYKQRELDMTQDYLQLKKKFEMKKCKCFENPNGEKQPVVQANSMRGGVSKQNISTSKVHKFNDTSLNRDASINDMSQIQNLSHYDRQKLDELRTRIKELENETTTLTRDLQLKYEECDALNDELRKIYAETQGIEKNCHALLQSKEEEIFALNNKINELDILVENYGKNLVSLKASYEKCLIDHKRDIKRKNCDMKAMKEHYEKRIRELHLKIEEILFKEKAREETLGVASLPNYIDKNFMENYRIPTSNAIRDDELVKNNSNTKIKSVRIFYLHGNRLNKKFTKLCDILAVILIY